MNIPNEAVEAAAKAMYEFKYNNKSWDEAKVPDAWRAHALVTLEAAVPHILKQRRQETRAIRAEENRAWAEQTRQDKAEAWNEGWQAQWEAEMTGRECRPNPYDNTVDWTESTRFGVLKARECISPERLTPWQQSFLQERKGWAIGVYGSDRAFKVSYHRHLKKLGPIKRMGLSDEEWERYVKSYR